MSMHPGLRHPAPAACLRSLAAYLLLLPLTACLGVTTAAAREPGAEPSARPALPAEEERTVASLPVVLPGLNRAYALTTAPSRTISAVYTYSVTAPRLSAREWVLFAARPPDLPGQRIAKAWSIPAGVEIEDQSPLERPLLRVRVPVDTPRLRGGIDLEVHIEAELFSRRLVPRKTGRPEAPVKALTDLERKLALRPTPQFDYPHRAVKAWREEHDLERDPREGEVDFARRVFSVIVRNFRYEYLGKQDRSASHVCAAGASDCGGLSALFVAALRSQGVPARTLAGRWARSAKAGEKVGRVAYLKEHVKTEFHARGLGWVPADLSSAVLHDRSPEKLRYFGRDPGDFLTMHVDTGLTFDTLHFGKKTMPLLQKASYWATGWGSFRGVVVREGWEVR